jgi:hypothetical protein
VSYINIHAINAAAEMYRGVLSKLDRMREELEEYRTSAAETGHDEFLHEIDTLIDVMATDISNMRKLECGLREAQNIYKTGIKWMDDIAWGDECVYPYTRFGVTYLEYLKPYADLMPFEAVTEKDDKNRGGYDGIC